MVIQMVTLMNGINTTFRPTEMRRTVLFAGNSHAGLSVMVHQFITVRNFLVNGARFLILKSCLKALNQQLHSHLQEIQKMKI